MRDAKANAKGPIFADTINLASGFETFKAVGMVLLVDIRRQLVEPGACFSANRSSSASSSCTSQNVKIVRKAALRLIKGNNQHDSVCC
jgi:hypothetical protein